MLRSFKLMNAHQSVEARLTRLEAECQQLRQELGIASSSQSELNETPQEGYVELKWISRKGKRYGPYRYLRWQENGKKKSKYLGKEDSSSPSLLTETQ